MKTYTSNGNFITVELTQAQIIETINSEFPGVKCSENHSGDIDIVFGKEISEGQYYRNQMEVIHDQFPELFLKHAYDGFSGSSFEFAFRTKYNGNGWTF